jgi:hypothetical protein
MLAISIGQAAPSLRRCGQAEWAGGRELGVVSA